VLAHQPVGEPGLLLRPGHRPSLPGEPCSQHREGPGERAGGETAGRGQIVLEEGVWSELVIGRDCPADYCLSKTCQD